MSKSDTKSEKKNSSKNKMFSNINRRQFVTGVTTASIAGGALSIENGPIQETEAFVVSGTAIAIGAAALAGGAVGAGWLLRDKEIIGKDDPPEGLTKDALKQQIGQAIKVRNSVTSSTIVDNKNLIQAIEQPIYTKGKTAAIEAINNGKSENEVITAANNAIDKYTTSVQKNFLQSWNEMIREFDSFVNSVSNHPNLNVGNVFTPLDYSTGSFEGSVSFPNDINNIVKTNTGYTLFNGDKIDTLEINIPAASNGSTFSPINNKNIKLTVDDSVADLDTVYIEVINWIDVYNSLKNVVNNTKSNVQTWVSNTYDSVKSNDISIAELTTPTQRANALPDGQDKAKAIADLSALNIPIDSKRKSTVTINSTGATLSGNLALTDSNDGPLQSGQSYDPSTFSGVVLLTTDLSEISGKWQNGNDNATLSGGVLEIQSKPPEGISLTFDLNEGKSITTRFSDWTYDANGNGYYTYDISSQISNLDGTILNINFGVDSTETNIKTIQLSKPFTINNIVNEETGETQSQSEFSNSKPQTDTNYITQSEWEELETENERLIEKYKEETSSNGGGLVSGDSFLTENYAGIPLYLWLSGSGVILYLFQGN